MIRVLAVGFVALVGCATRVSGPYPDGPDTFVVEASGYTEAPRDAASRTAIQYCAAKSLEMLPVDWEADRELPTETRFRLSFRCLPLDDPDVQRPPKDPDLDVELSIEGPD